MAESMKGLHRSHRCTEVSNQNIGETVTVMGWVQKRRKLGSLIFIDLRDRSGILQLVFNEESVGKEGYEKAERLKTHSLLRNVFQLFRLPRSQTHFLNAMPYHIPLCRRSLR